MEPDGSQRKSTSSKAIVASRASNRGAKVSDIVSNDLTLTVESSLEARAPGQREGGEEFMGV